MRTREPRTNVAIMNAKRNTMSRFTSLLTLVLLGGCASIPQDLGRGDVDEMVAKRGQPIETADSATLVESLLEGPLTAESSVRIALINNMELQAVYARLGFAAADIYEAGRIRNPIFSASILNSNQPGERDQITFGLVASFTDLLTLPARKRLARAEFAAMKQTVGAAVLETAADAESTYYDFVAAKQIAALRAQTAKAAELSAELAKRYFDAGNLTERDLELERAAASEAKLSALEAAADAYRARTDFATVLGLSVGDTWDAAASLPVPLDSEDPLDDLLSVARESRLDLAAAMTRADIVADRLGVTNWTRWLGELDIGIERERETDGARLTGPTLDWELPIFNQHRDALLRVDAELKIAVAEVAQLMLAVSNDVYLAYAATENAKMRFEEYRDQLVPARVAATARAQEEENFMLIGIFELLTSKQQEYDAYQGYLEAVRDYWLSRTALSRAVGDTLPSDQRISEQRIDVDDVIQPQNGGHSGHDMFDGDSQ